MARVSETNTKPSRPGRKKKRKRKRTRKRETKGENYRKRQRKRNRTSDKRRRMCAHHPGATQTRLSFLRKETTRPSDASDITDLESARAEVRRLRALTKHLRVNKNKAPRNFIFLDLDGVVHPLNAKCIPSKADYNAWLNRGEGEVIEGEFLPEHMALVKHIASKTNSEIVLSSTWREIPSDLAAVEKQFALHGLPTLAGCTPRAISRAAEICIWLENKFGPDACETCCFVALDDVDLIERDRFRDESGKYGKILSAGHFVQTDPSKALTAADAEKAIQLMHAQQQKQVQRKKSSKTKENKKSETSTDADLSEDGGGQAVDTSGFLLTDQTKLLIERQKTKLPIALENMKRHKHKVGHWAWWCFPTELEGASEPRPQTCVTSLTAAGLVHHAPKVWRELLEAICDLAEDVGKQVLPRIDHGRVKFFIKFWENLPLGVTPRWLLSVTKRLKPFYEAAR